MQYFLHERNDNIMDILSMMVQLMESKDVKNFKIYAGRAYMNDDRKDLALFDFVRRSGNKYSEEKALEKLYGGKDKNAFYRLKGRLIEDINESMFLQEYRENDTMLSFYYAAMGRHYFTKSNFKISYYFYKKAEKKARENENYGLLETVYKSLVFLSLETLAENPEIYIEKRRENRNTLKKMGELEDIVSAIEYRMKTNQNLSSTNQDLQKLLQKTIDEYSNDKELKGSARLQLWIYVTVSRFMLQKQDYTGLEKYLTKTYDDFNRKKFFNKENHMNKLQMLTWLVNALFKNKKYKLSLEYAEKLKQEMERYDKMLYARFEFFYYNSLVINFSVINPDKAIEILLTLAGKKSIEKLPFNGVFVFANLCVLYYQKKDFHNALKYLNRLYTYDGFKNTDLQVRLRIALGELIIRYDGGELEALEYRLKQIQKEFEEELEKPEIAWEKDFIALFQDMLESENLKKDKKVKEGARSLIGTLEGLKGHDDTIFNFEGWIKEKTGL